MYHIKNCSRIIILTIFFCFVFIYIWAFFFSFVKMAPEPSSFWRLYVSSIWRDLKSLKIERTFLATTYISSIDIYIYTWYELCGTENFLERSTLLTLLYVIVPYGLLEHTGQECFSNNQITKLESYIFLGPKLYCNFFFREINFTKSFVKLISRKIYFFLPRCKFYI